MLSIGDYIKVEDRAFWMIGFVKGVLLEQGGNDILGWMEIETCSAADHPRGEAMDILPTDTITHLNVELENE